MPDYMQPLWDEFKTARTQLHHASKLDQFNSLAMTEQVKVLRMIADIDIIINRLT